MKNIDCSHAYQVFPDFTFVCRILVTGMKILFLLIFFIAPSINGFAQQKKEEQALRSGADFNKFLQEVSLNKKENCICKPSEFVIYSFQSATGKTMSLCISKIITSNRGYLAYRFGSKEKEEFVFPTNSINSFSSFTFMYYSRGGGIQNAGMDLNGLEFTNKDYTYKLSGDYSAEENRKSWYLMITDAKTGKTSTITDRKSLLEDHIISGNIAS